MNKNFSVVYLFTNISFKNNIYKYMIKVFKNMEKYSSK